MSAPSDVYNAQEKPISRANMGRKCPMTGRHHSDETRGKMSETQSQRYATHGVSEETRRKMSARQMGRKRGPCSEERKRKIGEANRQRAAERRAARLAAQEQ